MIQAKRKIYVIDTCTLIDHPDVFFKLGLNEIVIPTAVVRELDGLKRNPDLNNPKAVAARKVIRTLDGFGRQRNTLPGANTATSRVRISNKYVEIDDLASRADNRIIGAALKVREDTGGDVILLTKDRNVRNIARTYELTAEDYPVHIKDSTSRPQRKPLPVRRTATYVRSIPARPVIYNRGFESKTIGAVVVSVIAIFIFILLVSAG